MNKISILLVEDEVIIAKCLQIELEDCGFDVRDFVGSGEEAIIRAKEINPDFILMDIHLAGDLDGIEAAQEIMINNDCKIIFATGYTEIELFERAQELNPLAYLRKPVTPSEVKDVIDTYLNLDKN